MEDSKVISVVVGILENAQGEVFVARCKNNQALWEFPGGKVEANESTLEALVRELREEIDIQVQAADSILNLPYQYDHANVLLHVFRVKEYRGIPQGAEGQEIRWVSKNALTTLSMWPANRVIVSQIFASEKAIVH